MFMLIKNLVALVLSIIVIHLIYIGIIHPNAEQAIQIAQAQGISAPRDIFIILKDTEQEICLIGLLWGCYLILSKILHISSSKHQYHVDVLLGEHQTVGQLLDKLQSLEKRERETPLMRVLISSLRHFESTKNVHNTSESVRSTIEDIALEQDSDNAMIRYIIWAVPSIGFIGTVRGIGQALSQADQALAGNIAGMTQSLGLAFNSTLVALFISLILMFLLYQLQKEQEKTLVSIQVVPDPVFAIALTTRALRVREVKVGAVAALVGGDEHGHFVAAR
ncbi:MAG: MotA/TolQ/ExbB proton channel family protein, partial [Pseudomonadota bacterium]